jgi:hypothetical protein
MALVNRVQYDQFSPGKMVIRQTPVVRKAKTTVLTKKLRYDFKLYSLEP